MGGQAGGMRGLRVSLSVANFPFTSSTPFVLEPVPKVHPGVGRLRGRHTSSSRLCVFSIYASVVSPCLAASRSALGRRSDFWERLLRTPQGARAPLEAKALPRAGAQSEVAPRSWV